MSRTDHYSPTWDDRLSPAERDACFALAFAKLGPDDHSEIEWQVIYLSDGQRIRSLGTVGALELLAALGLWLNQHAGR